jgi:hypothetical protein
MNRRNFLKTILIATAGVGVTYPPLMLAESEMAEDAQLPYHSIKWINENINTISLIYGIIPLKLNEEQIQFIRYIEMNDESLYLQYPNRQSGYTTAAAAYILYRLIHDKNSSFLTICLDSNSSGNFMDTIRDMYNLLQNQLSQVKSYSCDRHKMEINSNKLIISSYHRIHLDLCATHYKLAFAQDYSYSEVDTKQECYYNVDKLIGYSYLNS